MTLPETYEAYLEQVQPSLHLRSAFGSSWPKFVQHYEGLQIHEVTAHHVRDFHQDLLWRTGAHGALYKPYSIQQFMTRIRQILRWAHQQGFVAMDPSEYLLLPKPVQPSRHVLTWDELQQIFTTFDTNEAHGLRDAAMFGVVCETGLALVDTLELKLWQANELGLEAETRQLLDRYQNEARPILAGQSDDGHLFLGRGGGKLGRQAAHIRLQRAVRAAGISGQVLARTLRLSYQAHLERQLDRRLISF